MAEEAKRWWSRLGRKADGLTGVEALTAGASGSAVYRLHAKGDFILKHGTLRELYFYRDLAPHVPVAIPKLVTGIDHDGGSCLCSRRRGSSQS